MAFKYNLQIEAGATFRRTLEYTTEAGDLFDLTGYTARLQMRETATSTTTALDITPSIDVTFALVHIELTAAQTSTLTLPKYVYALEITGPGTTPEVIRLIEGQAIISPEVVR